MAVKEVPGPRTSCRKPHMCIRDEIIADDTLPDVIGGAI